MRKNAMALMCAATMALAAGCVLSERQLGHPEPGDNDVDVVLRLHTPGGFTTSTATRALSYASENRIETIHVMAFDSESGVLASLRKGQITQSPSAPTSGAFSVTLPAGRDGQTFEIVVLANLGQGERFDDMMKTITTGQSIYDEVVEALVLSIDEPLYSSGGTVPMWGGQSDVELKSGNLGLDVELTRAVARIDVGVGQATRDPDSDGDLWTWDGKTAGGAEIPFRLTSVQLFKPNDMIAVMPDPAIAAGKPTVPTGAAPLDEPWVYSSITDGLCSTREIYVPEADIRLGDDTTGDAGHTQRMGIVIGGVWDAPGDDDPVTYYRADFVREGKLIDVLRNHLYQFNITSVSGPGYDDPETAYNGESMNITVNVLDWEDADMNDIEWVGTQFFAFSERPVELTALGGERTVTLRTNIAEGFSMTLPAENNAVLTAPEVGGGSKTGGMYDGQNFTYILNRSSTSENGESTYNLTITAVGKNFGGSATTRSDIWSIAAGNRLTTSFEVKQLSSVTDPQPYAVTHSASGSGTTTSSHSMATSGTYVTLRAQPSAGYVFTEWEVTDGPMGFSPPQTSNAEMTFPMPSRGVSFTANFTAATLAAVADSSTWTSTQSGSGASVRKTITVTANTPWTASLSDTANFATSGTLSGSTSGTFYVYPRAANNADTATARQVTVIVTGGGITQNITLTHNSPSDKQFDLGGDPTDWADKEIGKEL